ncbi:MAG: GNAT family N-acetyltransferase [Promethearchaeota archaeon]
MNRVRKFPQLETERLILRELTLDDVEFYFHHFNTKEIIEGSCFPGPRDLETAKAELELFCINPFKEGTGIRWGIVRKGSSKLIGTCGYYDWSKTDRRAEIGYDLDPAYWGQGIMTEALKAMLEYGFKEMGLNRIQATIDSKNRRSVNLVRGLNFEKEGVLRQRSYFGGRFLDDVCFSILKKEWKEHSP